MNKYPVQEIHPNHNEWKNDLYYTSFEWLSNTTVFNINTISSRLQQFAGCAFHVTRTTVWLRHCWTQTCHELTDCPALTGSQNSVHWHSVSSGVGMVGRILGMVPECEYLGWPEQTPSATSMGRRFEPSQPQIKTERLPRSALFNTRIVSCGVEPVRATNQPVKALNSVLTLSLGLTWFREE